MSVNKLSSHVKKGKMHCKIKKDKFWFAPVNMNHSPVYFFV